MRVLSIDWDYFMNVTALERYKDFPDRCLGCNSKCEFYKKRTEENAKRKEKLRQEQEEWYESMRSLYKSSPSRRKRR